MFSAFGTLSIERSMLSGNSASSGGGILTIGGSASVTASTVSGNSAAFDGGGIYNESGIDESGTRTGSLTVTASTLNDNSASDSQRRWRSASSTVRLPGAQSRS